MKRSLENKIRFNIILIYLVIALICTGMALYIYNLQNNVGIQKENIEKYNRKLALVNELIQTVHQAQSATNLYISSRNNDYFSEFEKLSSGIEKLIDSLGIISENSSQIENIAEISHSLNENKSIVSELNKQFLLYNPLDSISRKLQNYDPSKDRDSLFLMTVRQDTIYNKTPTKGFWKRLAYLFAPKKNTDSLVTVSTLKSDTTKISPKDSLNVLSDVQYLSQKASKNYIVQLSEIKQQVGNLIFSDQVISSQISNMLIKLHGETIRFISKEIEKSEQFIRKNYLILFVCGIISLLLILIFIIFIIKDVNKGYAARKALEKANLLTKRLMEERHKLLLSVSHDIKAPLSSILGYLELWHGKNYLSEEEQIRISSMENSANYTLSLLQNLLEFSRLEKGSVQITNSNFNIQQLCTEMTEMFSPLAFQKKLSFIYKSTLDNDLVLYSDRLKVKQIIANILSNAIKYTISGRVEFWSSYTYNTLHLTIHDTGVGIPEEQMENIFKPFSRVEKNNSIADGSGFGLYVVKGLVESLNGEISITSKKGEGTSIKIHIFMKKATKAKDVKLSMISPALAVNKKYKILLIDDDMVFLSIVKEMLCKLDQETTICNTLSEFENLITGTSSYDIIITDRHMGTFSGVDILRKVREINITIPVWLMTAHSDFDDEKAMSEGFDLLLQKPLTLKYLSDILRNPLSINTISPTNLDNYMFVLNEMFQNNAEAITNILDSFVQSACNNIILLREAVHDNNFSTTQSICHKMLGTFAQFNITPCVRILKKMDESHGKEYENWQNDINELIKQTEFLVNEIITKYLED